MPLLNMVEAINLALDQNLAENPDVVVLGEDVGVDGGVFRVTKGLLEKYGPQRVIDTPLAEASIIGTAIGMAMFGLRPVAEIQFSDFSYQAFHQIEQNMARMRNRSHGRYGVPLVMRAPYGGGIRAVELHSESREAYYAHTPGLKVVIPSGPRTARALLHAAIADPDPVIYYEPKAIYRAFKEEVPTEPETCEIGRARVVRDGSQITLIAYGAMMRPTLEAAEDLQERHGVSAEVVDLLTISPLDAATFCDSVGKTGRAVVIHEAPRHCGVAAEVVARINEHAFGYLQAPLRRVTGFDIPFPFFQVERFFLPDAEDIVEAAMGTMAY